MDGSEGSLRAVRWAAGEARCRNARLHAVLAWDAPTTLVAGAGWIAADAATLERCAQEAAARLDEVLAPLEDELAGLEVERSAVHGAPASVLLEAAEGASALVVGTRGHGGFVGLLLGSVSHQCSHHAPCPVVIVPAPR